MTGRGYAQFCPVAKAAEIVAERWTPLVLRELMLGAQRFSEIRRGVPGMSPSLLSTRLRALEDAGLVERKPGQTKSRSEYQLTPAGRELRPVIELLGVWGSRWATQNMTKADYDPGLLMWDLRRGLDPEVVPQARTLVQFELRGVPADKRRWWLLFERGRVDVCLNHPGDEVDLVVRSHVKVLVDIWLGARETRPALAAGDIELEGSRVHERGFAIWFGPGPFARLERARGHELSTAQ